MSESTPHKRVLPARERAESIAKRQASSPAGPSTPAIEPRVKRAYTKRGTAKKPSTPAADSSTPTTPVEEVLPTKLQPSKPLPTSTQKQPNKLSNKEYQSIADSAVLAASLHRSRVQWLCEGVFQHYWTKPVTRKGVIKQPPGNPDGKSMTRLGNATMTVEPHVFDVTFYVVKDSSSIPPSFYRHPNQHTTKQPQPLPPPPVVQTTQPHKPPTSTPSTTSINPSVPAAATAASGLGSTSTKKEPAKDSAQVQQETSETQTRPSISTPSVPMASALPRALVHPPVQSVSPMSAAHESTRPPNDPVIQMLAARAAVNDRLRELMKTVATSRATHEQLREFQSHIDEFNKIIKQQDTKKGEEEKKKQPSVPAVPAVAAHPPSYAGSSRPHPGPPTSIGGPMHMAPPAHANYPPPRSEPFIKHVVVEFNSPVSATTGTMNDRWLFPEHAVLDIRSGGLEMVASFLVVRKGEDILKRMNLEDDTDGTVRRKFRSDVEYFQPVTVTIKTTAHKIIETIARAAKPLTECQSYMKGIMEHKTRAPQEYLVHQLPRDKLLADTAVADFFDSAVEMSDQEDDELKDVYTI